MSEQEILSRLTLKQDTRANWLAATSFIPYQGEPFYVTDTKILYIGDGTTTAAALVRNAELGYHLGTWATESYVDEAIENAITTALNTAV